MNAKTLIASIALAATLASDYAFAQAPRVEFPAPSPSATLKQRVGLTDFEIVYSRPSMKGRQIFGGLVPYGEVWRTGANAATKLAFNTPVKLGGTDIPAGSYTLFTIPGEKEWTVIISKGTAQQYDETKDQARIKVTPTTIAETIETFTIEFNHLRDDSAVLNLAWEKTVVPIKVELDLKKKLQAQIEDVMSAEGGQKPYFQAAMFYYDHGLDLQKAKAWADAAVKLDERYYNVHLQAKILAKLGEKEAAIAAANRSKELAVTAKDNAYVRLNESLVASLK